MYRICVGSSSGSDLSEIRPILPWNAPANKHAAAAHGTNGPCLLLEVELESIVEGEKNTLDPWYRIHWATLGKSVKLGEPAAGIQTPGPLSICSHDWTPPVVNDAGSYEQTATIATSFRLSHTEDREAQIDLRLLRTRYNLHFKHRVGDVDIDIPLSTVPWTSGIYRNTPSRIPTDTDVTVTGGISELGVAGSSITTNIAASSSQDAPPPYPSSTT